MRNQDIKGDWKRIKEKLRERWSTVADRDLHYTRGKLKNLIGRIHKRTGETKDSIEKAINESIDDKK